MAHAIQKVEKPGTITLKTERASEMRLLLQEEKEIRILVREYIAEQMVKPIDYGPMPGVFVKQGEAPKNVLFKAGAEKLFDVFKCKPVYRVLDKTVDPASGLYYYEIRCRAVHRETGMVMNEGLGSASSYESRYRYRTADRKCPACGKETILKSKIPPRENPGAPPGWYCYAKKGGCGANYTHDDPAIVNQESGKTQNPDLADVANTVLKIAKKRAQVDCAIGLARVSDLFTADLEDLPTIVDGASEPPAAAAATPAAQRTITVPAKTQAQKAKDNAVAARDMQIFNDAIASGILRTEFHAWAETTLQHPYSKNTDWTDDDRAALEHDIRCRQDAIGGALEPGNDPPSMHRDPGQEG